MKVVNSELLGIPSKGVNAGLLAVLTQDATGLYACYIGIVPAPRSLEDADWVAHYGAKQSFEKSKAYFRGIKETEYRH